MVGTGLQARLQLQCLKPVTDCREVWVWGRNEQALAAYRRDAEAEGFRVLTTQDAAELAAHCQLIVTTTPSREPILQAADIRPGTHITAVGADAPGKQELATDLVAKADALLVDALVQCADYGEIATAYRQTRLTSTPIIEMGALLAQGGRLQSEPQHITIADLTGLAIQDLQIAKGCWRQYKGAPQRPFYQPLSTNFSMARATPSSVLAPVTNCATAFSSGIALPIATPTPAYSIIAVSLA